MARVIEFVAVVTVLPLASSTVTWAGCQGGAVDTAAGLGGEDELAGARRR